MKKPKHELLDSLENDLQFYKESIREVSSDIMKEGISSFPVFIAHELEVSLGEKILDKDELGRSWSINSTILEELTERGVIASDKVEEFKKVYKDPKEFMCVFLISEKGGNFIFFPYGNKNPSDIPSERLN